MTIYSYNCKPPPHAVGAAAGALAPSGAQSTATAGGTCMLTSVFYGTGGPKTRPMARADSFTKLPGDVNKPHYC